MQRNPHSYQIATGYRTFYSLSLIYQPITKKRLFFTEKPLFRYDSSGPSHRNSNFQIPINEQKVPTPHFHKYWSDGKEIAYKTEALKDEVQRKALEDISICIYHFMQEANIEYENFQLNSSPGILPFDKEAENSDPLENITFKE